MVFFIRHVESEVEDIIAFGAFAFGEEIIGSETFSGVISGEGSHSASRWSNGECLIYESDELGILTLDLVVNEIPRNASFCPGKSWYTKKREKYEKMSHLFSDFSTAMKASCGISTLPIDFIRFLPSFCFSSSLRLREISPP